MRFAGVAAGPPVSAIMMKQHLTGMIFLMIGLSVAAALLALKAIKPDQRAKRTGIGACPGIMGTGLMGTGLMGTGLMGTGLMGTGLNVPGYI